jgi:hypothetical protein
MQIQINTDHNIAGHEALAARIGGVVDRALNRYSDHITRVELHLSDDNGAKGSQGDKRCLMEARLQGRQPIAVTHHSSSLDEAVGGAAGKLGRMIEGILGRLRDQRKSATATGEADSMPPEE